jgi:hypothetical protein
MNSMVLYIYIYIWKKPSLSPFPPLNLRSVLFLCENKATKKQKMAVQCSDTRENPPDPTRQHTEKEETNSDKEKSSKHRENGNSTERRRSHPPSHLRG